MVVQVVANRQICVDGDAVPLQVRGRADPGQLQNLRRPVRASRYDDLARRSDHLLAAFDQGFHARGAGAFDDDLRHRRIREHGEIG